MYRAKRSAGVALGLGLLLSLALGDSASAQGAMSVELTPSRDSGVSGTATFADVEGGVRVQLSMNGLPEAGVKHINHVHAGGTCADDRAGRTAPVTLPLNPVVAREDQTGMATTIIEGVTLDELFGEDKDRFVLLHAKTEEGQGVPPGISCADLVSKSSNGSVNKLPASGGIQLPVVLAIAAIAGALTLLRRLIRSPNGTRIG
jgi:hypothetical protein